MRALSSSDIASGDRRLPERRSAGGLLAALLVLFLSVSAGPLGGAEGGEDAADEYRAKASTLYNLLKFVDWPVDAFADFDAPIIVCVTWSDPFGSVLDDAIRGRRIGNRLIVAQRTAGIVQGCHVVFVPRGEQNRLPSILTELRGSSVLTVGEDEGFTAAGGMVAILTGRDRMRLDLNQEAASRARLKLSARLLPLSAAARRPGGPGK